MLYGPQHKLKFTVWPPTPSPYMKYSLSVALALKRLDTAPDLGSLNCAVVQRLEKRSYLLEVTSFKVGSYLRVFIISITSLNYSKIVWRIELLLLSSSNIMRFYM